MCKKVESRKFWLVKKDDEVKRGDILLDVSNPHNQHSLFDRKKKYQPLIVSQIWGVLEKLNFVCEVQR